MYKRIPILVLFVALLFPAHVLAQPENGCAPEIRALVESAKVSFKGSGDVDVVVVTDPLCWHCRLGHKLLGEYPELYRSVTLSFYPGKSFTGSDMAAWILEDNAEADNIHELIDFAYTDLRQPKTKNLVEARMIILYQFTQAFPEVQGDAPLAELYARLQKDNAQHVLDSARMAKQADIPGTPTLIAGQQLLPGYGPSAWIKALEKKTLCP